jgi:hypothetical protein
MFLLILLLPMMLIVMSGAVSEKGAWLADPATDCKVCDSATLPNTIFVWDGGCKDGFLIGDGVLIWMVVRKLDSKYQGSYVQGYMQGTGVYACPNGARYEGNLGRASAPAKE